MEGAGTRNDENRKPTLTRQFACPQVSATHSIGLITRRSEQPVIVGADRSTLCGIVL